MSRLGRIQVSLSAVLVTALGRFPTSRWRGIFLLRPQSALKFCVEATSRARQGFLAESSVGHAPAT